MAALIYNDAGELADQIAGSFRAPAILAIDGWTGAGKTTAANALAAAAGGSAFDIDDALIRNQKSFVPALQLDVIRNGLADPKGLIFVSGICLRQVLQLVQIDATAHVYVKRMATWGWADEDELDGKIPETPGASGEAPRQEMRTYHQRWQPHLRADYELHRLD